MRYQLSGNDQLVFSVISWGDNNRSGRAYYARIDAKHSDAADDLQQLTGKGDTPLLAIADLFIQANKLVSSD